MDVCELRSDLWVNVRPTRTTLLGIPHLDRACSGGEGTSKADFAEMATTENLCRL